MLLIVLLAGIFIALYLTFSLRNVGYAPVSPICEAVEGAHCYYVAPDGSDSNLGAFDAPFKTFKPAVTAANPGDFIYARGGTYGMDNAMVSDKSIDPRYITNAISCPPGETLADNKCYFNSYTFINIADFSHWASTEPSYSVKNGTIDNPITVKAYPGEYPLLTAPSANGKPLNPVYCNHCNNSWCNYNDVMYLNTITSFVRVSLKSYWTIQGFDMNGTYVSGNVLVGISGGSSVPGYTHDIIIRDNNIHDYVAWGGSGNNVGLIKIGRGDLGGPWNIFVWNNTLHGASDPTAIGKWLNVTQKFIPNCASMNLINSSDAQHYGAVTVQSRETYMGTYDNGNRYIEIKGNTIYNVPQAFFFKNPMYGPIEIQDNVIYDSESLGIMGSSNVHMIHNLVYNIPRGFWTVGLSRYLSDYEITHNITTPSPEYWALGGQNAIIKNNTFVGLNLLMNIWGGAGHNIQNNVFFGLNGRIQNANYDTPAYLSKELNIADSLDPSSSILKQITSDNNCFFSPYPDFQFVERHLTFSNGTTFTERYTYDQAKNTFGFDPNSKIIIQSNPTQVFVNPANHDYNLINPSQCPDMGYYVSGMPSPSDTTSPIVSVSPPPSSGGSGGGGTGGGGTGGSGGTSPTNNFTVIINPPTNLQGKEVSPGIINLTWKDNSNNETGFIIESTTNTRRTPWTELARVGANVNLYSYTTIIKDNVINYRVKVYNSEGESAYSNQIKVRTHNCKWWKRLFFIC